MADTPDITVSDLRGGLNDTDPITALLPGQCPVFTNAEFHCSSREDHSTIGTRRAGTSAITTPITAGNDVTLLHRHIPTSDMTAAEFWAVDVDAGNVVTIRYKDTTWHTVTPTDAVIATSNKGYKLRMQSLHGKLFIAYQSAIDRLHVRDAGATTIRRVGLAEPAAPAVANSVAGGTYAGTRYFRVRYTVQSGGVTILRSEPSDSTTFVPSGTNSGAVITKPATISENETHWEIEASLNNADFYRIVTQVVGTTTYTDTTVFGTGYASFPLSEDSGDYTPLASGKFIVADEDRLLVGSSWTYEALTSRVAWTTVLNDPGVGNDERAPVDTDNFVDLDAQEGGGLTDLSRTTNGYIFAFKLQGIYQLTRTGQRTRAYTQHCLTKERGAIEGSVVSGLDQNGKPALYFIDPQVGPCRIGDGGIQTCARDIHRTWETVNKDAIVVSRAIFYSDSEQVHWWIATNGATTPNLLIVLHVNESRQTEDGIRRGWVTFTGGRAEATSACMFADNLEAGVARSTVLRPYIGKADGTIHLCDTGTTDSGTAYAARIVTGLQALSPLIQIGIDEATVIAKAANGVTIDISVIKDFGVETLPYDVNLSPVASEDPVIVPLDEFTIAESYALQFVFADQTSPSGAWNLYMFVAGSHQEG